jgi:hypothetical protein
MMKVNKESPDWAMIKRWLSEQIDDSHSDMERGLTVEEYNKCRGHIALAKALIEWVEPTTPPLTSEDDYGISAPVE